MHPAARGEAQKNPALRAGFFDVKIFRLVQCNNQHYPSSTRMHRNPIQHRKLFRMIAVQVISISIKGQQKRSL